MIFFLEIVLRSFYPRIRPTLPPCAYLVLTLRSGPAGTWTMAKITYRVVDWADTGSKDYVSWDDELPGFGLRVFASGKRSYVIQYRSRGRSRRYTIGLHGVWSPETARREARSQLGRVAHGDDPAGEREEDRKALTIKQLCEQYITDMEAGLILGKGG